MVIQKHIVVSETIWNSFQKIRGKSHNDKMLNLLNSTTKTVAKEEIITKLLTDHMEDIKTILERQNNIIESQARDIQNFLDKAGSLMSYIENHTGY